MRYLLDSNILRYYTAKHPTMTRNLARVPAEQIAIPFVVVIEQLRGRFDAYLKAEPENLLREQTRLLAAQQFLSLYQTVYVDEQAVAELAALRQRVNTRKRYADIMIAAMALASGDIVVTRNVDDFRDLLPAAKIQNWVDQVY
jgi:predicted nucleic acid-binding protein